jgi:ATP-dependent DNA helicase
MYASLAPGGARLLRKQQTFLASMAGRTTNALPEFWARRRSSPLWAVAREAYAPDLDRRRRANTKQRARRRPPHHKTRNQRRRHAAGSIDEEPDEQAEEEARVTALLDQSQATETTPTSAPVLLQAAAATDKSINLDAKDKPEAKKAQLDTLLAKAEQYSQFIVNSQQAEAEPSKKKQKTGLEDAAEKMKKEKALVVQPKAMTGGTLKPYQVEGLRWLATLFENGLSGILADEMGLGKTIQVIALVAHVREKNVKGPICIAAPLATLPNWMNEFRKWTPGISALLYHGSKQHRADLRKTAMRKAHQNDDDFPVIVTSYEICILDRAALSHFKFKYLVIDEGQRVKNRDCRLVRELKKLDTENRLLLSGTPIQNTLEELWSLLNFVNPQIFDDLAVFQSWFGFRNIGQETQVDDIVDDESKDRIVSKLHEILRPFLLRRVKADVLQGVLPPKKEIVVYAAMTPLQKTYEALILQHQLKDTLQSSGIPCTGKEVSENNMLMNQRKNANHPFLFGEPTTPTGEFVGEANPKTLINASGKFRLLDRLLVRLKAGGHKVLLFSQMTELLNIIEDYVRSKKWGVFRIDGGVELSERQRQIDAFNAEGQSSNNHFIFLLSTRAGGLGINLASADTVVLFDSDWNPHQDSQAMDRAHRIGQTKPVVVYRLLTTGSVEIAMMEKQISKKKLERMAVTGGDYNKAGRRSRGDLTTDGLRALLDSDVNIAQRVAGMTGDDKEALGDDELELVLDREKIFSAKGIPTEGKMYDVVAASGGGGILGNLGDDS